MKFKAKAMHISTGGVHVAIMNTKDAFQFDFHALDRLSLKKGKKDTVVVLDVAKHEELVPCGTIGLYDEAMDALGLRDGSEIDVSLSVKPKSVDYIKKKLDGHPLNEHEIHELLHDITDGNITDIELTYYVAANYTHGMSMKETVALTKSMMHTGDVIKVNAHPVIDKHCIGGVANNRTTMVVVPILLACGLKVPKTSSRSITSPAGTADTMEVLCSVQISPKKMKSMLNKIGGFMIWGGSVNLAPADDTIINVEHPLSIDAKGQLLASIMAKKGSVSSTHVLVDIPVGKYAKMKHRSKALQLSKDFKSLGKRIGIKTDVIITDGNEPIGRGIGPGLEARDVLWILQNDPRAPEDLRRKSLHMAALMLEMGGHVKKGHGARIARDMLDSGIAHKKFIEVVKAQGKNPEGKIVTNPDKIPVGKHKFVLKSSKSGTVKLVRNDVIAHLARASGCPIDKYAGVYIHVGRGDRVKKGEKLLTLYGQNKTKFNYAKKEMVRESGIVFK